jgi:diacylglycerol O-acyltransferase / trehalose O-mycolyltransferase
MRTVHPRPGRSQARILRWLVLLLAVLLCSCGAPDSAQPSSVPPTPSSSVPGSSPSASDAAAQAEIVDREQVGERQWDLTIASPAVGGEVKVRLLLPSDYEVGSSRRWPVLYLLHGCCDDYLSWTRSTDIEQLTADEDLLVVMPDGGRAGFYSNWRTGPAWETFHLTELPGLLAEEYGAGDKAAIAGVSMGGLGALGYAARRPGTFAAAASFSGIVHTRLSPEVSQDYLGLVHSQGEVPLALWGDPEANADVWQQHNPYDLAPRLAGTKVFISCGNGKPGPLDTDGAAADRIEASLEPQNAVLAERLRSLTPAPTVHLYGRGTHNWVYWERELHRAWPLITDALGVRPGR